MRILRAATILGGIVLIGLSGCGESSAKGESREEGLFKIYVDGKEIGTERFALATEGESASSTSVVGFRNPDNPSQRIELESKLDMDGKYRPRGYRLATSVDGKKGMITGSFSQDTAMFEYAGGNPRKSGVLVGKQFTVLDTNVFHHFLFIVRLFKFDAGRGIQRFEVVVPQEGESGFLKVSKSGNEILTIGGKKTETERLLVDSGSLLIHLWVDKKHNLQKISVPSLKIEVLRS